MAKKGGRRKTTTIAVPIEVRDKVKYVAETMHLPMWRIIYEAVIHYREAYLSHFQLGVSELDKISWYCYKLSASVGELRGNPTKENLDMLMVTLEQIKDRLGIDTTLLEANAKRYLVNPDRNNKIALNGSAKEVIVHILEKLAISGEKKEKAPAKIPDKA